MRLATEKTRIDVEIRGSVDLSDNVVAVGVQVRQRVIDWRRRGVGGQIDLHLIDALVLVWIVWLVGLLLTMRSVRRLVGNIRRLDTFRRAIRV